MDFPPVQTNSRTVAASPFSSSNGRYRTRLMYASSSSVLRPFPVYSYDDLRQHFSFRNRAHQSSRSCSQQLDASFGPEQPHTKLGAWAICLVMKTFYVRIRVFHGSGRSKLKSPRSTLVSGTSIPMTNLHIVINLTAAQAHHRRLHYYSHLRPLVD